MRRLVAMAALRSARNASSSRSWRAHQNALGAVHQLALVELLAHLGQLLQEQLLVAEPGLRQLDHGA
jgi:hypothetical protein